MKKTKKVISYIMLLVPLALPAGCSPVSTSSGYNDQKAETDDDSEQLRLIVERYFEQQERQQATQPAAQPALQETPEPTLVESEEELKEELEELKKTGEWTADNLNGQTVQCNLEPVIPAPVKKEAVPVVQADVPEPIAIESEESEEFAVITPGTSTGRRGTCDFPVLVNKQVQFYLNLFQGKQRKNFIRWMERSSMYMPFITVELEKAGLPLELSYLAMIESGFNPSAYSPSHASGLWQFIPGTGRNFGLRVDSWADERRDPEKSTKAAAAYLKALYKRFGDWHLAVAAYNAGEGAVERGLKQYKAKNFWELAQHDHLRLETKRYVPQMIAAVLIARNPQQYGFSNIRHMRPMQHELVRVPSNTPLQAVATSASVSVEQLRSLNNDLLQDQVPETKRGWLLKVPVGRSALVAANLPKAQAVAIAKPVALASVAGEFTSHKVAKNETLQQISKKYGISLTALLKVNNLRSSKLKAGQSLRVPSASSGSEQLALAKNNTTAPAAAEEQKSAAATQEFVTHKLKKGETLSEVADKYGVPTALLMKWNKIAKASKVKAGQQLTVYPAAQETVQLASVAETAPAPVVDEAEVAAPAGIVELTAGSTKRKPGAELIAAAPKSTKTEAAVITLSGSKKQKAEAEDSVSYYKVRSGDSLWSISKKLQVSAKEIKNWNRLNNSELQPGVTLVIKNG
ncbi:MAG: membrane-bound lytic murein transglycosylase D [Candidatus Electronema aureum]|uniref:Membrane-bound lytic murein transglycosylase D n=1 Tax=Candidatus Electronema aureum TaxID=2005002 RepID=A0A521G3S8_9BACT|nr:MAG: membrane-bound lytic murein transglycosylase D [Candidatus Electronema aureum]